MTRDPRVQPRMGCTRRRWLLAASATAAAMPWPAVAQAQSNDVALAGLAFAGDAASLDQRFPYSRAYEKALKASGKPAYMRLREAATATPPAHFNLVMQLDELKGRDQAVAVALLVSSETVSVEQFGGLNKLFVLIRAQAMFFDFKSMSVIRAYPISFGHIDVFDHVPSEAEVAQRVRGVYEGAAGKPGIFTRFGSTLAKATLPGQASRLLQVAKVSVKPEAMAMLPEYLSRNQTVADTWAADIVGEALSTRTGVPVIPYTKGYAVGNVMSMRISDGDVYNLKLPQPDYEISLEFTGMKKIKHGESAGGASWIYGSYATLKIEEPVSGKVYLNTPLKNGEVKLVPVTQTYVDDFPAYYDSINGLFHKLAEAIDGKGGTTWVKAASSAPDIEKQITTTRELIKLCK